MALKFTGDETLPQVFDRLLGNAQELYDTEIRLATRHGGFQGELVGKGGTFIILKSRTGRFVGGVPDKEVIQTHLVALDSITGISFEHLK